MKAVAGLVYKFAIPRNCVRDNLNLALYINVGGGESCQKCGLTDAEVEKVKALIGLVDYADYVFCHCYLGFRPSELLALTVECYNADEHAFVGGGKTAAGIDRKVTVNVNDDAALVTVIHPVK